MKIMNSSSTASSNAGILKKITATFAFASLLLFSLNLVNESSVTAHELKLPRNAISQSVPYEDFRYSGLPNPIARAVLRDASQRSQIPPGQLRITQVTPKTFSNPCEFNLCGSIPRRSAA
jgi:hypothetical protein